MWIPVIGLIVYSLLKLYWTAKARERSDAYSREYVELWREAGYPNPFNLTEYKKSKSVQLPSVQPIPAPLRYSSEVPLSEYGSAAWVHQYGNCVLKEIPLPVWFIQPWVETMQVSPAEQLIINELNKYPVEWHREVSFRDMPQTEKGSCYRYDFLLPAHRTIIEYDGIASHSTTERVTADQIKTQFCQQHNINLIRLSSRHYYHMEKTICNLLQELPPKSA